MNTLPLAAMQNRQWQFTTRDYWVLATVAPLVCMPVWLATAEFLELTSLASLPGLLLVLVLIVCCYTDTRYKKIPNWITYPMFGWAVIVNLVTPISAGNVSTGLHAIGISNSLIGAAACGGVMLVIYLAAGGGAGDVKLACVLGSLLGIELGLQAIVISHILAGMFGLAWITYRLGPVSIARTIYHLAMKCVCPVWVVPTSAQQQKLMRKPLPLAAFFAGGVLLTLFGVPSL